MYRREKWRSHFAFLQALPIDFAEEGMVFDFGYTLIAQPVFWLTLNQSVNKVNALLAPSEHWDLIQLHLFGEHFLSDFLTILADVGPLYGQQHTLPVINSKAIIPSAKKSTGYE